MGVFEETAPSLDSYWRAIILFGRNVASYKLALGQSLLDLGCRDKAFISSGAQSCTTNRREKGRSFSRRNEGSSITCVNDPTVSSSAVFDFIDFARKIYAEKREIYLAPPSIEKTFLLPALYGGDVCDREAGDRFEALVVLEGPSEEFTKQHWNRQSTAECATAEEAVNRHRRIFFQWAFDEPQAQLFLALVGQPAGAGEFFRRLYVTDVWKDAAFRANRKRGNPDYRRHWHSKLKIEIESVAAERVIFVGRESRRSGWQYVPPKTPRHCIVFPSWRNKTFEAELQQLVAEIQGAR